MTTLVGRNLKVEVALTFSSALSPTAVTKANPSVATLTSHGMSDGAVGYWTITAGMTELDKQAAHVIATTSGTFTMNGVDTTNYSTYTAGTFTPAATWGTVAEAAGLTIGGGAADALDDTRLTDTKKRNVSGMLAPQDMSVNLRNPTVMGSALAFILAAARNSTSCLFRVTQGTNVLGVYYGVPSVPGLNVQASGLASGDFGVIGEGWFAQPNLG